MPLLGVPGPSWVRVTIVLPSRGCLFRGSLNLVLLGAARASAAAGGTLGSALVRAPIVLPHRGCLFIGSLNLVLPRLVLLVVVLGPALVGAPIVLPLEDVCL